MMMSYGKEGRAGYVGEKWPGPRRRRGRVGREPSGLRVEAGDRRFHRGLGKGGPRVLGRWGRALSCSSSLSNLFWEE